MDHAWALRDEVSCSIALYKPLYITDCRIRDLYILLLFRALYKFIEFQETRQTKCEVPFNRIRIFTVLIKHKWDSWSLLACRVSLLFIQRALYTLLLFIAPPPRHVRPPIHNRTAGHAAPPRARHGHALPNQTTRSIHLVSKPPYDKMYWLPNIILSKSYFYSCCCRLFALVQLELARLCLLLTSSLRICQKRSYQSS